MAEKIRSYRDLRIWQKGIEIVKKVYEITADFPKAELYALASQMRRASISIPSNIAEGFMRHHSKEYKQFLYVALGSNAELETQVILAGELGYIDEAGKQYLLKEIDYLGKMIMTLVNRLTSNKSLIAIDQRPTTNDYNVNQ